MVDQEVLQGAVSRGETARTVSTVAIEKVHDFHHGGRRASSLEDLTRGEAGTHCVVFLGCKIWKLFCKAVFHSSKCSAHGLVGRLFASSVRGPGFVSR